MFGDFFDGVRKHLQTIFKDLVKNIKNHAPQRISTIPTIMLHIHLM